MDVRDKRRAREEREPDMACTLPFLGLVVIRHDADLVATVSDHWLLGGRGSYMSAGVIIT